MDVSSSKVDTRVSPVLETPRPQEPRVRPGPVIDGPPEPVQDVETQSKRRRDFFLFLRSEPYLPRVSKITMTIFRKSSREYHWVV